VVEARPLSQQRHPRGPDTIRWLGKSLSVEPRQL